MNRRQAMIQVIMTTEPEECMRDQAFQTHKNIQNNST